jgi:hypothetical protein
MGPQEYLDQEGEQFNLVLGKQNTLQQLYSTNEAMLFTLQDIKETEEKQLEGMWNIPSGSTFWVPLTSAFYEGQEGAGGFPELPELIPPTEETAKNTGQLTTLGMDQITKLEKMTQVLRSKRLEDVRFEKSDLGPDNVEGRPDLLPGQKPAEWAEPRERYWHPGGYGRQMGGNETEQEDIEDEPVSRERYWHPGDYGEETQDNEELGLWQKILETLRTQQTKEIQQGNKRALYSPAPTQTQTKVDVEIPRINGDFRINNTVTLDGRVIARYVSRVVEDALARSIRASGRSRSQTIR